MFEWDLVEDAGRGYRRVVASPKPVGILNAEVVRAALGTAGVVIAGGGGGIPVARRDGRLMGVEAVIDKDYTAALLAETVGAELLLILTAVDHVSRDFGTEAEQRIEEMTVAGARELLRDGYFPPGSMAPKIEASIDFVEKSGGSVLITSVEALPEALAGSAGTRIVKTPDGGKA
jgi:carbamate kinase